MSSNKPILTKSRLKNDLTGLGLSPADTAMLHVSVKAIGWIAGGPDVILQAILEVLGKEGTLMMMVGWEDYPYYIKTWPEEKQKAYWEECPPFDPATSRANREFSILAEYLRTWPGPTFRSRHPTCSCVAIGPKAEWLTSDHALQYGFGVHSPFAKLCEAGGKVLNIGASLDTLTILHHAEDQCNLPDKRIDRYQMPILVAGQRKWVKLEEYHTDEGIVDWEGQDYFELIAKAFIVERALPESFVVAARSYLFDASDLVAFGKQCMEANF